MFLATNSTLGTAVEIMNTQLSIEACTEAVRSEADLDDLGVSSRNPDRASGSSRREGPAGKLAVPVTAGLLVFVIARTSPYLLITQTNWLFSVAAIESSGAGTVTSALTRSRPDRESNRVTWPSECATPTPWLRATATACGPVEKARLEPAAPRLTRTRPSSAPFVAHTQPSPQARLFAAARCGAGSRSHRHRGSRG